MDTQNTVTMLRTIERLQRERDVALARAEKAERECGEMREVLKRISQYPVESEPMGGALDMQDIASGSLSSSCGVGYRSPEEVRRLVAPTMELERRVKESLKEWWLDPKHPFSNIGSSLVVEFLEDLDRIQREIGEGETL